MTQVQTSSTFSWKLIAAFAAVYVIWGSTYLAIHFAIDTMPPLLMLGTRFGFAGLILLGFLRLRGEANPSLLQWRNGLLVGTLTLGMGTGAVAWAEQTVSSGVAALIVTSLPIWMVLLEWKWKKGLRPNAFVFTGLALGVVGIVLLVEPAELMGSFSGGSVGVLVILGGSLAWAVGSLQSRDMELPSNPAMSTALQMTMGGFALIVAGLVRGEGPLVDLASITISSWLAWLYLLVFGSLVAFSAYVWLMHNAAPGQVSTYAYVNPVVAVFLGWLLADEPVGGRMLIAALVLVSAVVMITRFGSGKRRPGALRLVSGWLGIGVWTRAMDAQKGRLRDQFKASLTDRTVDRSRHVNHSRTKAV